MNYLRIERGCSFLARMVSEIFKVITFAKGKAEAVSLEMVEHASLGFKMEKNCLLLIMQRIRFLI
jgi:hypothetical protein